jgi:hypothetical protein
MFTLLGLFLILTMLLCHLVATILVFLFFSPLVVIVIAAVLIWGLTPGPTP